MSLLNKFLFLVIFSIITQQSFSQAPDFAWVKSAGGTGGTISRGIAVDGGGNSYVTGWFSGSITIGSTTLSSNGWQDFFIMKYDAAGNVLWAKSAGGSSQVMGVPDSGNGIAVDNNGNSYITGQFIGSASFGSTMLSSNGFVDVFIVKYDTEGNVLWAKNAGGSSAGDGATANGVAIDGSGNSYITGQITGNATFGNTTISASNNAFIAKYDTDGNVLWAKSAGGTCGDCTAGGKSIAVDDNGNSYVTGYFFSNATFGNATVTSSGGSDVFIAKHDAGGNLLWVKAAGGATSTGGGTQDVGNRIVVDGNGNSLITGHFKNNATFGNFTLISSSGNNEMFVAKFDAAGNVLWAINASGAAGGNSNGHCLALDGSGNSYITGYYYGTTTIGGITFNSNGYGNAFFAKTDAAGNILWIESTGGIGGSSGSAIALDGSGNCYVTGELGPSTTFGSFTLTSNGQYADMFLAKIGNAPLSLPSSPTSTLSTYPNPFSTSFQISLTGTAPATATLTDMLGRQVYRQVISAEGGRETATITPPANLPSGMYVLQVQEGENVRQVRVMRE